MPRLTFALVALLTLAALAGCGPQNGATFPAVNPADSTPLDVARRGFTTKLARQVKANRPVDAPPAKLFTRVQYDAPVGTCAAYLTPDPKDGKKRPAIVWITGGDCNTIGDVWSPAAASNDQTARQYRDAGVVMMFPSLRGGNQNPGVQENFFGEVDDVLAAADYLAGQEYVDPDRVYLGGHSTGGTLVMLVAAVPNRFRAAFAFGPADTISNYEAQYRPAVNMSDTREVELRSPGRWVHCIRCPTFVFEGVGGNLESLQEMKLASTNPLAHFYPVRGATHFSVLAPVNRLVAKKIIADDGPETNLTFIEAELNQLFGG